MGPSARGIGPLFAEFRVRRHLLAYDDLRNVATSIERIIALLGREVPTASALLPFLAKADGELRTGPYVADRIESGSTFARPEA